METRVSFDITPVGGQELALLDMHTCEVIKPLRVEKQRGGGAHAFFDARRIARRDYERSTPTRPSGSPCSSPSGTTPY